MLSSSGSNWARKSRLAIWLRTSVPMAASSVAVTLMLASSLVMVNSMPMVAASGQVHHLGHAGVVLHLMQGVVEQHLVVEQLALHHDAAVAVAHHEKRFAGRRLAGGNLGTHQRAHPHFLDRLLGVGLAVVLATEQQHGASAIQQVKTVLAVAITFHF